MRCTEPAPPTKRHTVPAAARGTMAPFATDVLATKLRFEASGSAPSHGCTVTKPEPEPPSAVTFNTTDAAPTGTPPRLAIGSTNVDPGAFAPAPSCLPSTVVSPGRVSSNRAGINAWKPEAAGKYPS